MPAPMLALLAPLLLAPPPAPADSARALLERLRAEPPHAAWLGVMTDRPLYRPGDTIWLRVWGSDPSPVGLRARLVDARGRAVAETRVDGSAAALDVPGALGAGRYTLEVAASSGEPVERPVVIERVAPPPLRLVLSYARSTHRPGDPVVASVEVRRPDGAPLADRPVKATARAGQGDPIELSGRTDAEGRLTLRFDLPARAMADARLNLRFDDGGAVSALTRPIPLAPDQPTLRLLPEGGDAVAGLPGRIYAAAVDRAGRPVSFSGRVLDDRGVEVARLRSVIHGRDRFELTPAADRTYRVELDGGGTFALPTPRATGCALRAEDDFAGTRPTIGVDLRCTEARRLMVIASREGAVLDARELDAARDPQRVELKADRRRGPVLVTVFDADGTPLAERVVFRNRDRGLRVTVEPDRPQAAPGEEVRFTVKATDADGQPVDADLALAVVDDGLLDFADDRSPDLVAQRLLMPVVRGHLEEAGRYLAPGEEAGRSLDLLMGTAGHRRFEWLAESEPDADGDGIPDPRDKCPQEPEIINGLADDDGCPDRAAARVERAEAPRDVPPPRAEDGLDVELRPGVERPNAPARAEPERAERGAQRVLVMDQSIRVLEKIYFRTGRDEVLPISLPIIDAVAEVLRENPQVRRVEVEGHTDDVGAERANLVLSQRRAEAVRRLLVARGVEPQRLVARGYGETMPIDRPGTREGRERNRRVEFRILDRVARQPRGYLRRFPPPPPPTPERDDFRETVAWVPRLMLSGGEATVRVRLSDGLTAFRATAQGVGGEAVGRGEAVVIARRPLAIELDAPTRLLRGDALSLPVTIVNHSAGPVKPRLSWSSTPPGLAAGAWTGDPLRPGERRALRLPLAAQAAGFFRLDVTATGGPWTDAVQRELLVQPRGYLQRVDRSGTLKPGAPVRIRLPVPADAEDVDGALILTRGGPATLLGAVTALVRQPSGCFEQTSAIHWPNVMALRLFERSSQPVAPEVLTRTREHVAAGAARLAGFAVPGGGFSKYGRAPASPAITAFGIIQLGETGAAPASVRAAVDWLDGHRTPERAGPGGEAAAAWIDWALAVGGRAIDPARVALPPGDDPYVLAVRTLALHAAGRSAQAGRLADALVSKQGDDGAWPGGAASITYSWGDGLTVETTGLAVRALAALDRDAAARDRAIDWLHGRRRGGAWVSTQATAQALAAILTRPLPVELAAGRLEASLDGRRLDRLDATALDQGARIIELATLKPGGATLTISQDEGIGSVWSVSAHWRAETVPPPEAPALSLATAIDRPTLAVGEAAALTATVTALRDAHDPLVRVGLPAGLDPDREQLRTWTERGRVALAEAYPGEVVLYLDDMAAGASLTLPLTVTARRPGLSRGPASSAYPYYTPDAVWAPPLEVRVE